MAATAVDKWQITPQASFIQKKQMIMSDLNNVQKTNLLLYGANGYTGQLIAGYAALYGLSPILAARRKEAVAPLAEMFGFEFKVIDLNNEAALVNALKDVALVIHAAGPYDHTAKQMVEACLKTSTHYIDLNGDATVFEMLLEYDEAAKAAGIMILPGSGFDVVPTDCLSMHLINRLPDATHLQIAFATPGGAISHGTAITTVAKLGEPGAVRINGKLVPKPIGHKGMWVNFFAGKRKADQKLFTMTIPWGDIFTAYISTGIPNIETYTAVPRAAFALVKMQGMFNWLLRKEWVRNVLRKKIKNKPPGLNDEQRNTATTMVWGKVSNSTGKSVSARLCGPDAYTLTAYSCLIIAREIIKEQNFKTGYHTPATAYGEGLVLEIPGVEMEVG